MPETRRNPALDRVVRMGGVGSPNFFPARKNFRAQKKSARRRSLRQSIRPLSRPFFSVPAEFLPRARATPDHPDQYDLVAITTSFCAAYRMSFAGHYIYYLKIYSDQNDHETKPGRAPPPYRDLNTSIERIRTPRIQPTINRGHSIRHTPNGHRVAKWHRPFPFPSQGVGFPVVGFSVEPQSYTS
jgi:hypothetical protein